MLSWTAHSSLLHNYFYTSKEITSQYGVPLRCEKNSLWDLLYVLPKCDVLTRIIICYGVTLQSFLLHYLSSYLTFLFIIVFGLSININNNNNNWFFLKKIVMYLTILINLILLGEVEENHLVKEIEINGTYLEQLVL